MDIEQAGHGPDHGGLAGSVGAEEGDDAPLRDLEADPLEHEDDVLVDDLEVLDSEHRGPLLPWRLRPVGRRRRPRRSGPP